MVSNYNNQTNLPLDYNISSSLEELGISKIEAPKTSKSFHLPSREFFYERGQRRAKEIKTEMGLI